ncbi:STAS domain-containing protein [Nonomuraea basaltis]|uniref:STAS domain-containing protein n=1 Tax=Nonomuraea basaltis TaxID=2495887 RepID=UPI001486266E|nr:STAS domain-containing protein [Nonomuraea basaltis]
MDRLDVNVEIADGRAVVRARGEIDLETAGLLGSVLENISRRCDGRRVEVDLGQVPFMDCSGLRELIRANRCLRRQGETLTLVNCSRQVDRLLEIAGLDHRLGAPRRASPPQCSPFVRGGALAGSSSSLPSGA